MYNVAKLYSACVDRPYSFLLSDFNNYELAVYSDSTTWEIVSRSNGESMLSIVTQKVLCTPYLTVVSRAMT